MLEENANDPIVRIYLGTLRAGLLIRSEGHAYIIEVVERDNTQTFSKIHFDKPIKVEADLSRTWDGVATSPLWDYSVKLEFNQNLSKKTDDELKTLGRKKLDSLASRMSFIASVPVFVLPGSYLLPIEDKTTKVIDGITYHKTVFTATDRGQFNPPRILGQAAAENYKEFFCIDKLRMDGAERIERSLRWLLHSYKAPSVVDEFLSLMIALEAISNLLSDSASESYWECSNCGKSFQNCPSCQNSTARPKPGEKKMRDFVVKELSWSKKEWDTIWNMRSRISHGDKDISSDEEAIVAGNITKLERSVISAISHLVGFPKDFPGLRQRNIYGEEARLEVTWRLPENEIHDK